MKRTPIKRHTPLKRVSKKRSKAWAEYLIRRKRFLQEHPYCQVFLAERGLVDTDVVGGVIEWTANGTKFFLRPPLATEIHHKRKPKATYLNDESTWMAVCRVSHEMVENNKSWAREKGYLDNI